MATETTIMQYQSSLSFAQELDVSDPIRGYRQQFYIPQIDGKDSIYLCGNSLGLQPRAVEQHLMIELEDWRRLGVEGHVHARNPWLHYHEQFSRPLGKLVGAAPSEVVCMNQLTVNLNLLLITFYQPAAKRTKIVLEGSAFPSDYYAVEQQIRLHGLDPQEHIIELLPRDDEATLRTADILATLAHHQDGIALVLLGAVNYYTGQLFDIPSIATCCRQMGLTLGLDLAHAIGNVPLSLHEWGVDFATWCSYKYLNSGPGGVSGIYIHERYADRPDLPRLVGWWGNDVKDRFKMEKHFVPKAGAEGWQQSNAPVLSMAAHRAAIDIFEAVGMLALRQKSLLLTGYLEYLIQAAQQETSTGALSQIRIITPASPAERGCQLSLQTEEGGRALFDRLTAAGVIADWREPDVIRIAPVPLYNTFEEMYRFVDVMKTM